MLSGMDGYSRSGQIPLWRVRLIQFLRRTARIILRDTLAPIFNRGEFFSLLAVPLFLFIVFSLTGSVTRMEEEFTIWWAGQLALIWALPIWFAMNLLRAPFKALDEERVEGVWSGRTFVYHTPKVLLTALITSRDNQKPKSFRLAGISPGDAISIRIESDQWQKVQTQISMHDEENPDLWSGFVRDRTLTVAPVGGRMYLHTHAEFDGNPTIIHVKLVSWHASEHRLRIDPKKIRAFR